jgi:hypothetical protein
MNETTVRYETTCRVIYGNYFAFGGARLYFEFLFGRAGRPALHYTALHYIEDLELARGRMFRRRGGMFFMANAMLAPDCQ